MAQVREGVRAIPLGSGPRGEADTPRGATAVTGDKTRSAAETPRGSAAVPGGRRHSPDDATPAPDDREGRTAPEPAGRAAVHRPATGWASVPTSGIPTIAVGNIYEADHVNSIIAAGRADLSSE